MSKVTPLKAGSSVRARGDFKIESFNILDEEDQKAYAELRNRQANKANGIEFENIREYSRKTVEVSGDGESRVQTTTEEIILVVQYWERPVGRIKGDSDEETRESKVPLAR